VYCDSHIYLSAIGVCCEDHTEHSKMPRGLLLQQVVHIVTTVVHKEEDIFVLRLGWICGPAFSPGMYKSRQAGGPDD